MNSRDGVLDLSGVSGRIHAGDPRICECLVWEGVAQSWEGVAQSWEGVAQRGLSTERREVIEGFTGTE